MLKKVFLTVLMFTMLYSFFAPAFASGRVTVTELCMTDLSAKSYAPSDSGGNLFGARFEDGMLAITHKGKYGFLSKDGKIITPTYEDAGAFNDGLAPVKLNGKWGYINKSGKMVIKPTYYVACEFSEGLAGVSLNGSGGYSAGVIDKTGKIVIPFTNSYPVYFHDGVAIRRAPGNRTDLINTKGQVICNLPYDDIRDFSNGLAVVGKGTSSYNMKYGMIDRSGKVVIPMKYSMLNNFREGLAAAHMDGKMGFIDKAGKPVIPFQYQELGTFIMSGQIASGFSEGLAVVKKNDKYGYIDKSNKTVVPFEYSNAYTFSQGRAVVSTDFSAQSAYRNFYIDKTGRDVFGTIFTNASSFDENGIATVNNGSYYFIDKDGDYVIDPQKYDLYTATYNEDLVLVSRNNKLGVIKIKS